jgi:hypothetical protein
MDGFLENNLKQIGLPQQRMPMQQPMQNIQSPTQVTEYNILLQSNYFLEWQKF